MILGREVVGEGEKEKKKPYGGWKKFQKVLGEDGKKTFQNYETLQLGGNFHFLKLEYIRSRGKLSVFKTKVRKWNKIIVILIFC